MMMIAQVVFVQARQYELFFLEVDNFSQVVMLDGTALTNMVSKVACHDIPCHGLLRTLPAHGR